MADVSRISLDEAYRRGFDIWEQILTDWGNVGTGGLAAADYTQVGPPQSRAVAGVAISPASDVAEVYINRTMPYGPAVIATPGDLSNNELALVAGGSPLVGGMTAPWSVTAPGQTFWGDTYTQINGTSAAFGTQEPLFRAPTLRLLAFLGGNGPIVVPPRLPLRTVPVSHAFAGATEELVRIEPIFGRATVRVSARVSNGTTVNLAINGVGGDYFGVLAPLTQRLQEFPLGTLSIAGAGTDNTGSVLVTNPNANFLVVKATRTVGAGTIERLVIDARD